MAKVVVNLNKSTLTAKKLVVYTILRVNGDAVKPATNKFFPTRTAARMAAALMNAKAGKFCNRVAKTVLVHA